MAENTEELVINPLARVHDLGPDMLGLSTPYGKSFLMSEPHIAVVRHFAVKLNDTPAVKLHEKFGQDTIRSAIEELLKKRILLPADRAGASISAYAPLFSPDAPVPSVHVVGGPGGADISMCLERMGAVLKTRSGGSTQSVVLLPEYLMDRTEQEKLRQTLGRLNSAIPASLTSAMAVVGPSISDARACFMCVIEGVRELNEVDAFLMGFDEIGTTKREQPSGLLGPSFVAAEIFKYCAAPDNSALDGHVVTLELITGDVRRHKVRRRSTCRYCQPPRANSPLRRPDPIKTASRPKGYWTSGGMRVCSSAETLNVLRELVSPITGVVTSVTNVGATLGLNDLHTFIARHPWNPRIRNVDDLRKSLRHKSSGKGTDAVQAEISALAEAVERYSGIFRGTEVRHKAPYPPTDERYIHPNEITLYSDSQIRAAKNGRQEEGARWIPVEESGSLIEWSPLWSLTHERFRYAPTALLYFFYEGPSSHHFLPTSNGCASGNTVEEAIVQGFLELVERDAFSLWWYNHIDRPMIPDSVIGTAAMAHKKRLDAIGVQVRYIDITSDLGIPCVVAVGVRDADLTQLYVAAGCHFDVRLAVLRASTELVQHLCRGSNGAVHEEHLRGWKMTSGGFDTTIAGLSVSYDDQGDEVERAKKVCAEHGLELLVLDQTRSHVGFPTVRVVVPGLRLHWPRFAPGRLFDVPVQLGWIKSARSEADLLPVAPE